MPNYWCVMGRVIDGPNQVIPEFEGAKLVGPPEEGRIAKVEATNVKAAQTLCKRLFPSASQNQVVVVTEAEWQE